MNNIKRLSITGRRRAAGFLMICAAVIAVGALTVCLYGADRKEALATRAPEQKMVAAYVRSTRDSLPNPGLMTHIYYAFGVFTDTEGNIVIEKPERFEQIVALREVNPELKIILSIGGGPKEGFSEMAASGSKRRRFAANCKSLVERYGLAGIDLDWEFPTTTRGGHTASKNDARNYGRVMQELRRQLGDDRQLSFYSNNGCAYIDYSVMIPYVDYVMVSGYNLGRPPKHQSNLYSSEKCGDWSVSKSIERHLSKGIPPSKIMMGVPFYALRDGEAPNEIDRTRFGRYLPGCTEVWDSIAQAPYMADAEGNMVASMDNERSLRLKCDYIRDNGLAGIFYWHYDNDDAAHSMAGTLHDEFLGTAAGE